MKLNEDVQTSAPNALEPLIVIQFMTPRPATQTETSLVLSTNHFAAKIDFCSIAFLANIYSYYVFL